VELEQSYDDTLEALGSALDLKDAETEGHCQRVTAFLHFDRQVHARARPVSSHLSARRFPHDIGKMAIRTASCANPARSMTRKEEMREHCEIGYNMLIRIPFLRDAAEIVLAHQEFFDGSGYPRRTARRTDSSWCAHLYDRGLARRYDQRPPLPPSAADVPRPRRNQTLLRQPV